MECQLRQLRVSVCEWPSVAPRARPIGHASGTALGFCHHLGFTGLRTGNRNMLGLKP